MHEPSAWGLAVACLVALACIALGMCVVNFLVHRKRNMVAIVIVPDSLKAAAEQCVSQLSPESVGESFTIPLCSVSSPSGPVTHWASLPIVSDAVYGQVLGMATNPPFAGQVYCASCGPEEAATLFAELISELQLVRMEQYSG